jgi:hypothetical protein
VPGYPACRTGALALAMSATLLAAGCGRAAAAPSAAAVIAAVADQTGKAASATAVLDLEVNGGKLFSVHGTVKVRTAPGLAMEIDSADTSNRGRRLPGGMTEILAGRSLYIRIPSLAAADGDWVEAGIPGPGQGSGPDFASLIMQAGLADPLAAARMLGASTDVKAVGQESIGGVASRQYHGTYSAATALSWLSPAQRQVIVPPFRIGIVTFDAWVDGRNQLRQVTELLGNATLGYVTITMRFTSAGRPVSVTAAPRRSVIRLLQATAGPG